MQDKKDNILIDSEETTINLCAECLNMIKKSIKNRYREKFIKSNLRKNECLKNL